MPADHLRRLDEAADRAGDDVAGALALLPWLVSSLALDRAAGRFDRWARSTAIDGRAGEVIPRRLFDALHRIAGLDDETEWPIGNAGLLHVYGYLLSTVATPFGPKRDRWLGADLARAFGGPDTRFHPWAGPGTLLERVTDDASALLHATDASRRMRTVGDVETVVAVRAIGAGGAGGATGAGGALAYGIDDGRGIRLVTLFAFADDPAAVLDDFEAGPPRLRWNAALPFRRPDQRENPAG